MSSRNNGASTNVLVRTHRGGRYPHETQEMVFDAHDRAFAFLKGACTCVIYDNMKTAVETIFVGKDWQ